MLVPHVLLDHYSQVSPAFLKKRGIKLLLTDLDFTLATKKTHHADENVRAWVDALHQEGVAVVVISNNRSPQRVEDFCAPLGIAYQAQSRKPRAQALVRAMEQAGVGRQETAMLGDKLLTDVLAAKNAGVLSLMVEPLGGAITPWQKVLHTLQRPFKAVCRRRGGGI